MTKFGSILVTLFGVGWFCGAAFGATSPDIDQAGKLISEGDHAVAVERLSDIIREEQVTPKDMAEAYFLRGTAQQELGLLGHSVADFTKAIWLMGEASDKLPDAHFHRGQVYSALRQLKRAIGDFDRAIELRSNFAQAYAARGDAYRDRGVHRLAIDDYGASIRYLNPDLHIPFYGRGLTYETMGRTQQAMADFRRAYELAPDFMPAREKLFDQTPTGSIEGPDALLADASTDEAGSANGEDDGAPTLIADAAPIPDNTSDGSSEVTETSGAETETQKSGETSELRPTLVELPATDAQQSTDATSETVSAEAETTNPIETVESSDTATSASLIAPDKVLANDGAETNAQASSAVDTSLAQSAEVATTTPETVPDSGTAAASTAETVADAGSAPPIEQPNVPAPPDASADLAEEASAPAQKVEEDQQTASSAGNNETPTPATSNDVADAASSDMSVEENTGAEIAAANVGTKLTAPAPTESEDPSADASAGTTIGAETTAPTSTSTEPSADATSIAAVQPDPPSGSPVSSESAPTAVAAPIRKTGFFVQIASYRDEGEASLAFDRIAARHSEVLSGAGSDIARADLGSKGVYYRLRVGPYDSIGSSSTVCSQLKARNQDCLVIEEK